MKKPDYKPEICECCGQTKTYAIAIDRGTCDIMKAIATYIGLKGVNCVHPRKEMEGDMLTSNQVGNLSRPRLHGLIARVKGNPGNYLLTPKGARFLRGEMIPKTAIVLKATEQSDYRNIGYWNEETDQCTIHDFQHDDEEYWNGIGYTVEEGHIVYDELKQSSLL